MSDTPRTDEKAHIYFYRHELENGFIDFARDLERENAKLREELDWQNMPNRNPAARGAYEFYINEEWMCVARMALDEDSGHATLMKTRYDPDDERVRVRRVLDDDALLADLAAANERADKLEAAIPDECPVTGLPFFTMIGSRHDPNVMVPTYGGPYDSYTIPVLQGNRDSQSHELEWVRERFDHNEGAWKEGCETLPLRLVTEEYLVRMDEQIHESNGRAERAEELAQGHYEAYKNEHRKRKDASSQSDALRKALEEAVEGLSNAYMVIKEYADATQSGKMTHYFAAKTLPDIVKSLTAAKSTLKADVAETPAP